RDRAGGVFGCGRVDRVIGADHQDHRGFVEVVVDLVHFQDDVVGHLGFGQQDVHVSGQTSSHRVDTEPDLDTPVAQLADQIGDRVLGLGHGHTVAGCDDDRVGVTQQFGRALGGDLVVFAHVIIASGGGFDPEPAGDHRDERAVHGLAHDVG